MQDLAAWIFETEENIRQVLANVGYISDAVTFVARFFFPVLALIIFLRCFWPLMSGGRAPRPWAYLHMPNGARIPISHWENSVGRGKLCDICIDLPSVSRTHAVIARKKDGWYISDLDSKGGVTINGEDANGLTPFRDGDVISLAGVELTMTPALGEDGDEEEESGFAIKMARIAARFRPGVTLLYMLGFQLLGLIQFSLAQGAEFSIIALGAFLAFISVEVIYYILTRGHGRRHIEPELLAFFLSGIGFFVAAAADPMSMFKQFGAMLVGIALFLVLTFFLNNPERARTARYVFAAGSLALLAVNLIIAPTRFGARNWIELGPISFQPSEFVKVAFVFAGGAALERLLTKRNLALFMGYSAACVGALALMRDFGSAAVFFMAFLVIAFIRSGDVRVISIVTAVTGVGGFIVASFMPYILQRFSAWRNVWALAATSGYQQTRTMIYTASGGLLGVGPGNGYLRYVAAADTDLVFGLVAEEWGLVVALICALTPLALSIFAVLSSRSARSAFYVIVSCGAAAILLGQAAFNVLGSLDILPLTGVTLPFVSNGGSSMAACWGLLACIKSVDERHRAQSIDD